MQLNKAEIELRTYRMQRIARRLLKTFAALLTIITIGSGLVRAQTSSTRPNILKDVGIDQKLGEQVPLDLVFRDEMGRTVRLGDYFGSKPVILSLVYFNCPMLCTMVENGLLESLKNLKFNVGDEFQIVTVSFNPEDTPRLAAAKKDMYVNLYGRPAAAAGWHFLTGEEASIHRLTSAVGFHYSFDSGSGQYAHATAIMVLTPDGRLSRYFFGIRYPASDLRLGLVEASSWKIGTPVDAVLLYCCQYNPATGKYGVIISHIIQLAGFVTLITVGTLMLMLFRAERERGV
jgi:protein SCO1